MTEQTFIQILTIMEILILIEGDTKTEAVAAIEGIEADYEKSVLTEL